MVPEPIFCFDGNGGGFETRRCGAAGTGVRERSLAGATVLPLTPVEFEITGLLRKGGKGNLLVVETNNAKLVRGVLDQGWNGCQNDGGLIFR